MKSTKLNCDSLMLIIKCKEGIFIVIEINFK